MHKLTEIENQPLLWSQSKDDKRVWELMAGEALVGSLAWQNPTADGTRATVTSADGQWTFKRVGAFVPRMTVRIAGQETDLATMNTQAARHHLKFADGRKLYFARPDFWSHSFVFTQTDGTPLLTFKRNGTRVELSSAGAKYPDASLLALFGCYLLHLYARDAEAGALLGVIASL